MYFPYWYKLIDCWVNTKCRSGLTIPFILGVKKEFIDPLMEINESTIDDFINDVVNTDLPQVVLLFRCSVVDEYVLGLDDRGGMGGNLLFSNIVGEPTLVIKSDIFSNQNKLSEISSFMSSSYNDVIKEGKFSKNLGDWTRFTDSDIEFITTALDIKKEV